MWRLPGSSISLCVCRTPDYAGGSTYTKRSGYTSLRSVSGSLTMRCVYHQPLKSGFVYKSFDGLGNPLRFLLSSSTRNDIVYAEEMPEPFELNSKKVLADMVYDQEKLCAYIRQRGGIPVIPSRFTNRIQRDIDMIEYKDRASGRKSFPEA